MLHADVEAREVGLKMYDRLRPSKKGSKLRWQEPFDNWEVDIVMLTGEVLNQPIQPSKFVRQIRNVAIKMAEFDDFKNFIRRGIVFEKLETLVAIQNDHTGPRAVGNLRMVETVPVVSLATAVDRDLDAVLQIDHQNVAIGAMYAVRDHSFYKKKEETKPQKAKRLEDEMEMLTGYLTEKEKCDADAFAATQMQEALYRDEDI